MTDTPNSLSATGKVFKTLVLERKYLREKAIEELWARNGLKDFSKRDGYKIAETKQVNRDGTEIIEYRLYKLVDVAVSTLSTKIVTKVEVGLKQAKEFHDASDKKLKDFENGTGV